MKIKGSTITIEISLEEWTKIQKEVNELKYGNDKKYKYDYSITPHMHDFLDSIENVAKNIKASFSVDRPVNRFE